MEDERNSHIENEFSGFGESPFPAGGENTGRSDASGEFPLNERGGVISARGTAEGLMLRIDGRVSAQQLQEAVTSFVQARSSFLQGQELSIEWFGARPDGATEASLLSTLSAQFGVQVREVKALLGERSDDSLASRVTKERSSKSNPGLPAREASRAKESGRSRDDAILQDEGVGAGLFGGARGLEGRSPRVSAGTAGTFSERGGSLFSGAPVDSMLFDEPDARMVYGTLRSGQRIESEHSVVIVGDVNSGAEVVSGGDIIVLGCLRGVAHAGAFEESGGGRVIIALSLLPTQLRIGSVISRGSAEGGSMAEVARVEGALVVVEPYSPKALSMRRR